MGTANPQIEEEADLCPNCGGYHRLVESTGWCPKCTLEHDPNILICSCGAFYPRSAQVSKCWTCRKEDWNTRHADEIEELLAQGYSLYKARLKVAENIRPTCNCCGEPIRGGREGSLFCRKNAKCRKQAESFRALKQTGLSPDVALAIATERVTVILSN